jgi:hypothetical protein
MDLVACEFGVRSLAGDDDGAAFGVDFDGVLIGGFERQEEERSEHFNNVVIGVVVIIEQDDVVERLETLGVVRSGFWRSCGSWQAIKW